jgi:hypothetical protein
VRATSGGAPSRPVDVQRGPARLGLEVNVGEGLRVWMVVVHDDERCEHPTFLSSDYMREKRMDGQLSLNALVVNPSRTETILGCRMRVQASTGPSAA